MAPRSLGSSSLKAESKLDAGDMNTRRQNYDHGRPPASEEEDFSASKPRLEGFCRGSWWDVDIVQQRDRYFLAKYLSPSVGEVDAWLPLNHLRLKSRKSDDWDCNILKRGMDVSVLCTHPQSKELKLHSTALYDAKITSITRAAHKSECTCTFHVRFYCANSEDPIGCSQDRLLLAQSYADRNIAISTVSILQQPGIVPFYEILKSHLSKKWIQVSRWSNDAFFLRETKLNLHVPPNHGENWLYDDDEADYLEEVLLTTSAVKLDKPAQPSHSSRGHHSHEQETVKVHAPKARSYSNPEQFPRSETKNCAENVQAIDGRGDVKLFKFESDTYDPRGGMSGRASRKDSGSHGDEASFVDKDISQVVRTGVKRSRDDVPVCSRKKNGVGPEQMQKERKLPSGNSNRGQDMTATSLGEGNSEDVIVHIGGGSSDEGDVYTQPPLTRVAAKNLHTSGRRSDEGVRKRGRPRLKRDDASSERKPDSGFEKFTSQNDVRGTVLQNKEEDQEDWELFETDAPIKVSVAGRREAQKERRKKGDTNDSSQSEEHGTVGEPNKLLSRLRPRRSGKKQVSGTGASVPGSLPHGPLKPDLGKRNRGVPKQDRPLYQDVLEANLVLEDDLDPETGKRMHETVNIEMQREPKFGLGPGWDPLSFRYLTPSLEEKLAKLEQQKQQEHSQHLQQQQSQPEHLVADNSNYPDEAQREEKVLPPHEEGDLLCPHTERYIKEDVGVVCAQCALVMMSMADLVPSLERQLRHSGEGSDWDAGSRSPDAFEEATVYQKIHAEKEVTWMSSCNLPLRIQLAMHPHQKDGFAFLWRNLACGEGSNRRMREDTNTGCILSHAPGTGKTFLVIAFLQSYMSQFPKCRPLIVAPKIMLRQWEKEFERWKSDIPVHILNTARESGKRRLQEHESAGVIDTRKRKGARFIDLYRLAMLYEWRKKKSVLLVSYNLFSCLADESRDSSKDGDLVRNTLLNTTNQPILLVLDEGHFPRNKGTRIRQSLMKVKTNIRILLSGTLFQNNFDELFNTLYLVRPGFLDGFRSFVQKCPDEDKYSDLKKFMEMEQDQGTKDAEKRARKWFVEKVGMSIEQGQSSKARSDELDFGLGILEALTKDFVHHHTGEVLAALPGLRDFALILKPTQQQCSLLEVLEKSFQKPSQYLEREIAVSQTSIHPVLVRGLEFTKFLDVKSIFKHYRDLKSGSGTPGTGLAKKGALDPSDGMKTKFVFDLLLFSKPAKEKVLIFSQHITPLELLIDMFIAQFKWRENFEYLKLDGKLPLDERAKIIEKFNNPNSEACVLLASTKACGEGISLVGASRVVFLDVLWNPAVIKQAMSRAFRLGQKKTVYVYRLIASGTIEESKYKKAIRKDWLSRSIFRASHGEAHKASDTADENAGEVRTDDDGAERGTKLKLDGNSHSLEQASGQELLSDDKKASLRSSEKEDEDGHRLRKIQELLAWEVDVTTCKDAMLEKVLEEDLRADWKTFLKVIEHGSDFRDKTIPFGPDAREWFLEGVEDNEHLNSEEVNAADAEVNDLALTDSDEEEM